MFRLVFQKMVCVIFRVFVDIAINFSEEGFFVFYKNFVKICQRRKNKNTEKCFYGKGQIQGKVFSFRESFFEDRQKVCYEVSVQVWIIKKNG